MVITNIAALIWKRHQSHWNWIIMFSSLFVLFMALWMKSLLLTLAFIFGIAVSLKKMPDPAPPFALVEKALEYERKWLAASWGWKKSLQAFGLFSSVIYVLVCCWSESLMPLLLLVGIYANIACVYGNKRMGVDDL